MATSKKVIVPPKKKTSEQPIADQFEGKELKDISKEAENFIEGKTEQNSQKKKLINFNVETELLSKFDAKAKSLGLNRSSLLSLLMNKAVSENFEIKF